MRRSVPSRRRTSSNVIFRAISRMATMAAAFWFVPRSRSHQRYILLGRVRLPVLPVLRDLRAPPRVTREARRAREVAASWRTTLAMSIVLPVSKSPNPLLSSLLSLILPSLLPRHQSPRRVPSPTKVKERAIRAANRPRAASPTRARAPRAASTKVVQAHLPSLFPSHPQFLHPNQLLLQWSHRLVCAEKFVNIRDPVHQAHPVLQVLVEAARATRAALRADASWVI